MFNKDSVTDDSSHTTSSLWCLLCVFGGRGVYIKALFLSGSHLFFQKVASNFLGGNSKGLKHNSETDETDLHVNSAVQ